MPPETAIESFEVFATGIDHPECLAFDRHGILWAGGEAGQIYRISSDAKVQLITTMGGFCGGLAFSPQDELFVCNPSLGIVRVQTSPRSVPSPWGEGQGEGKQTVQQSRSAANLVDPPLTPSGEFSVFATHAGAHKLICPNYGLFDSTGNYYVTDSGNWKKNNGHLIRFNPQGEGQPLAGPLGYANGLALSADERSLFMVESNTDSVLRFEIRPDNSVGPAELYADGCGRFPDGLVLDAAGNLYVCCYASDEIWRISPAREKSLFAWDRWAILLGSPTNMAFGGKDFDELYVANLARTTITRAKVGRKGQPLANQQAIGAGTSSSPQPSRLT